MRRYGKASLLVTGGLVAGVALALHYSNEGSNAQTAAPPAAVRQVPDNAQQLMLSYAPVVERAAPAVVNIFTTKVVRNNPMMQDPFFQFFFGNRQGMSRERVERSLGSGVIVSADGLIVTNRHVVGGADEIRVVLNDRREYEAKLILADERSDLALVRIDPAGKPLPVLPLADSDRIKVGDLALAIGNPFGVGQTVTHGIVSALRSGGEGPTGYQYYIQTDAPINPGNSGGALVGMDGKLLGINTFIYSQSGGSVGIGFAIPVNLVKAVIAAGPTGKIVRPWVGLEGQAVDAEVAEALKLPRADGVLVSRVSANSPAGRAGVKAGDVITAIDGRPVADPTALQFQIATRPATARIRLDLVRDGKALSTPVTLAPPPETPPRNVTQLGPGSPFAGLTLASLSPALAQELNIVSEQGVIVLQLSNASLAARLNMLRTGDIIESVNGQPVTTVDDVRNALGRGGGSFRFGLQRGGQRGQCIIQPPSQAYCQ